eukprot:762076-Hanusia_phi.AAC.2
MVCFAPTTLYPPHPSDRMRPKIEVKLYSPEYGTVPRTVTGPPGPDPPAAGPDRAGDRAARRARRPLASSHRVTVHAGFRRPRSEALSTLTVQNITVSQP